MPFVRCLSPRREANSVEHLFVRYVPVDADSFPCRRSGRGCRSRFLSRQWRRLWRRKWRRNGRGFGSRLGGRLRSRLGSRCWSWLGSWLGSRLLSRLGSWLGSRLRCRLQSRLGRRLKSWQRRRVRRWTSMLVARGRFLSVPTLFAAERSGLLDLSHPRMFPDVAFFAALAPIRPISDVAIDRARLRVARLRF